MYIYIHIQIISSIITSIINPHLTVSAIWWRNIRLHPNCSFSLLCIYIRYKYLLAWSIRQNEAQLCWEAIELTHHGQTASPASWPYSAARPMVRVYLSDRFPRSQWACRGYFPRISEELLSQQRWPVLDCGCGSGSFIIIKTAHWIVWARIYLPPFDKEIYFMSQLHKANIHNS